MPVLEVKAVRRVGGSNYQVPDGGSRLKDARPSVCAG